MVTPVLKQVAYLYYSPLENLIQLNRMNNLGLLCKKFWGFRLQSFLENIAQIISFAFRRRHHVYSTVVQPFWQNAK